MAGDILKRWRAPDGTELTMRPMRRSDAAQVKESLNRLSPETRRYRFFVTTREFSDEAARRLTDVDPRTEFALVVVRRADGREIPIAGGRIAHAGDDGKRCEFSLLIGDAWQGQGIGHRLLKRLIAEAVRRGLQEIFGLVHADNRPMLALARAHGFMVGQSGEGPGILRVARDLQGIRRPVRRSWLARLLSRRPQ